MGRDGRPGRLLDWRASGGALLSAVLLFLAQPPFGLLPLAFLALVPVALALARAPGGPGGGRYAAWTGFLFGVVFWGVSLLWIPLVVGPEFSWAYGGYLVLLLLLGSLTAGFGLLLHGLHVRAAVPLFLALPLGWVAVEWIKGHVPLGLAFPWLGLGVTLAEWPELLGAAEWVGEGGVAFWLAAVNGTVAHGILVPAERRSRVLSLGALAVLLLPAALGVVRSRTLPLAPGPRVAVIGTEIPVALRHRPEEALQEGLRQLEEATAHVAPGTLDLLVLPEGFLPGAHGAPEGARGRERLRALVRELQVPILVGGQGEPYPGGQAETASSGRGQLPTNSAFLLPLLPDTLLRYDKSRLVPGMEMGRYEAGDGSVALDSGGLTVGPLICYESLFGSLARSSRRKGAQILVNLSSDIWFGGRGSASGNLFLEQHPAHLVLRAVEERIPVARAGNGGYTFLMDPAGRYVAGPVLGAGVSAIARVPMLGRPTLYSRTGDWVGPGALLICVALLTLPWRRSRTV